MGWPHIVLYKIQHMPKLASLYQDFRHTFFYVAVLQHLLERPSREQEIKQRSLSSIEKASKKASWWFWNISNNKRTVLKRCKASHQAFWIDFRLYYIKIIQFKLSWTNLVIAARTCRIRLNRRSILNRIHYLILQKNSFF